MSRFMVLQDIEPTEVFRFFEEICAIPHPSYKEKAISDYLVAFAKARNLKVQQDDLYNVIIVKEASPGYEDMEPVIIQGHMDMVCEKTPDCTKDMEREGLDLYVEGDYVRAKNTTLGGDDGIAVAYALALLDSHTISHPKLEVVITVSEEVGMEGASHIDLSGLTGRTLLNIDSEEEGIFLTSCAGGCLARLQIPTAVSMVQGLLAWVSVSGLAGGHSGTEIDKNRGNANVLLARVLNSCSGVVPIHLVNMEGGKKDNVIPSHAEAKVLLKPQDWEVFESAVHRMEQALQEEYRSSDDGLSIAVEKVGEQACMAVTDGDTKRALAAVIGLPDGVQYMSSEIAGLVETSLNLGIMTADVEKGVELSYCIRSSVTTRKHFLVQRLQALAQVFGGTLKITGDYPAWEYRANSPIREKMISLYRQMYGKEPEIQAIHAGLECGILVDECRLQCPDTKRLDGEVTELDCVSFGPDILDIHTVQERLSISSTKRVWEFLIKLLEMK